MTKNRTTGAEGLQEINLDIVRNLPKGEPWKNARQLENDKEAEVITIEQMVREIEQIEYLRDAALIAVLYVCGARVSEIVNYKKITWGTKQVIYRKGSKTFKGSKQDYSKKTLGEEATGIKKSDIYIESHNGRQTLIFRIRNLKNRNREHKTKLIPLPLDDPLNKRIYRVILAYIQNCPEELLFNISKRRVEQILAKEGINPHFLRKLRLTHLAKYYNFTDQQLQIFAGWTDSRPSKHYIRLRWQDLIKSM